MSLFRFHVAYRLQLVKVTGFLNQEADWMNCLTCVVRGQLDPVFSFKDEHKSEQDFKIKYNMYRYWNAVSVGYAQYLTIIPGAGMGYRLTGYEGERNNVSVKSN